MTFTIDSICEEFPALQDKVFLDAACVSLAPRAASRAIQEFLEEAMYCPSRSSTIHHIALDSAREPARREAARLIGADPQELALVESTTQGLSIAARALDLHAPDNVLVADLEFFQVPLAWRQGMGGQPPEVRLVRNENGRLPAEAYARAMDDHTRAVIASSVQWSNGYRMDLEALGKLCRERGACLIVDAIQQLGAFPIDVGRTPIDFLACGGHKWLNAPFGQGFLYIRKGIWEELAPPVSGYLSLDPPQGGWEQYFQTPSIDPLRLSKFVEDARRFENGGTSNYPGAIGLGACLGMINELGPERIEAHIRLLTDRLISGLETLGMEIVTPREPQHRSGIVSFGFPGDLDRELELKEFLLDRKVLISVRYTSNVGGVRASCHFYNTPQHIDTLLNAVEDFLSRS